MNADDYGPPLDQPEPMTLNEEIRSLIADYDEAVADYKEALGPDDVADTKDYELYEDRLLDIVHEAIDMLRRTIEEN